MRMKRARALSPGRNLPCVEVLVVMVNELLTARPGRVGLSCHGLA
jgi:hypothetical protein